MLHSTGYNDKGQGLVEYVLILVLVAVALVFALNLFGGGLASTYAYVVSKLP